MQNKMSLEADAGQVNNRKYEGMKEGTSTQAVEITNNAKSLLEVEEECSQTEVVTPRKQRERRNKSPTAILSLLETFASPLSPASSSCTSQGNSSADVTFEPSIDMMVNDFDDEQTLNEEEALAATEHQDPQDEIATLREESEMPLEELLAKYQVTSPVPVYVGSSKKKNKRAPGSGKHSKHRKAESELTSNVLVSTKDGFAAIEVDDVNRSNNIEDEVNDVILIDESGDEEVTINKLTSNSYEDDAESFEAQELVSISDREEQCNENSEKSIPRRTHLMDLYPEETFIEVMRSGGVDGKDVPIGMLYNAEDDEEEDANAVEEEEEEDVDTDYVKKTIMVGPSYQATIPDGLSQYGDVLPYENEDKLIWEPSQVSERQVEEYLLKARDIKPSLLDNGDDDCEDSILSNAVVDTSVDIVTPVEANGKDVAVNESSIKQKSNSTQSTIQLVGADNCDGVIKDNEQALHLLVQCGYDFKEALRRKRLNALPLTGSMSLWSEEECHKFEEGIQKFGKDFLKIRQNQVRTRTMRELVQFYYLWKKSDRRDHNFANSDTVDHMDIYLNEGGDYSPTAATNGTAITGHSTSVSSASNMSARKHNSCVQKSPISIMMIGTNSTNGTTAVAAMQLNVSSSKVASNRKRSGVVTPSINFESPQPQSIALSVAQTK